MRILVLQEAIVRQEIVYALSALQGHIVFRGLLSILCVLQVITHRLELLSAHSVHPDTFVMLGLQNLYGATLVHTANKDRKYVQSVQPVITVVKGQKPQVLVSQDLTVCQAKVSVLDVQPGTSVLREPQCQVNAQKELIAKLVSRTAVLVKVATFVRLSLELRHRVRLEHTVTMEQVYVLRVLQDTIAVIQQKSQLNVQQALIVIMAQKFVKLAQLVAFAQLDQQNPSCVTADFTVKRAQVYVHSVQQVTFVRSAQQLSRTVQPAHTAYLNKLNAHSAQLATTVQSFLHSRKCAVKGHTVKLVQVNVQSALLVNTARKGVMRLSLVTLVSIVD
jgi:hypothetical protein